MAGLSPPTIFLILGIFSALLSGLFFVFFIQRLATIGSAKTTEILHEKISSAPVLDSIDNHFAGFVKDRLGKEMPVLNMFIDDQLIEELRHVFRKEVAQNLPELAQHWMGNTSQLKTMLFNQIWRKSRIFLWLFLAFQATATASLGWLLY